MSMPRLKIHSRQGSQQPTMTVGVNSDVELSVSHRVLWRIAFSVDGLDGARMCLLLRCDWRKGSCEKHTRFIPPSTRCTYVRVCAPVLLRIHSVPLPKGQQHRKNSLCSERVRSGWMDGCLQSGWPGPHLPSICRVMRRSRCTRNGETLHRSPVFVKQGVTIGAG